MNFGPPASVLCLFLFPSISELEKKLLAYVVHAIFYFYLFKF